MLRSQLNDIRQSQACAPPADGRAKHSTYCYSHQTIQRENNDVLNGCRSDWGIPSAALTGYLVEKHTMEIEILCVKQNSRLLHHNMQTLNTSSLHAWLQQLRTAFNSHFELAIGWRPVDAVLFSGAAEEPGTGIFSQSRVHISFLLVASLMMPFNTSCNNATVRESTTSTKCCAAHHVSVSQITLPCQMLHVHCCDQ